MATLDITAITAVLRQKYEKRVEKLCYPNNPLYALMKKNEDFGGINKVIALRSVSPQSRSAVFSTAVGTYIPSVFKGFTITRKNDYAVSQIAGEAIEASKGNENALLEALTTEIDGVIFTAMRNLAFAMYRNGGGARGQISSGSNTGTATVTLTTIQDITNFEVGMVLQGSSTDGTSGATRNSGAVEVLKAVDRDLGTLGSTSAAWNSTIAALAASDYLFQKGDHQADATYGGTGLVSGLSAWVPSSAPSSTAFFGVDRSVDVTRLGGVRYAGSGGPIEESLIEAGARVAREGGTPSHVFLNPLDYSNLVKALGSKVVYDMSKPTDMPDIGFRAVNVIGPNGDIKAIPDLNCPKGTAFMLTLDMWSLESLGKAPRILDFDGLMLLRDASADAYNVRAGYYAQVACRAPGWNANITL